MEKKVNKFKTPFIHVETKKEYKEYVDIICHQFKNKIEGFLYDEEIGLLAVMIKYDHKIIQKSFHESDLKTSKFSACGGLRPQIKHNLLTCRGLNPSC